LNLVLRGAGQKDKDENQKFPQSLTRSAASGMVARHSGLTARAATNAARGVVLRLGIDVLLFQGYRLIGKVISHTPS
jgi:hypothetical protein